MRLSIVLDLMGLQAFKQGQITNNWQNQGPDYWLREIKDKKLFLWSSVSTILTLRDAVCCTEPQRINDRFSLILTPNPLIYFHAHSDAEMFPLCLIPYSILLPLYIVIVQYWVAVKWSRFRTANAHPMTLSKVSLDPWESACLLDTRERELFSAAWEQCFKSLWYRFTLQRIQFFTFFAVCWQQPNRLKLTRTTKTQNIYWQ